MEDLAAMGRCHGMAESVGAVTGGLAAKARCNDIATGAVAVMHDDG